MKIIKILGIAAGLHVLALIFIFANPGCSYTKAAGVDAPPESGSPISAAPEAGGSAAPAPSATEPVVIRYSPTRPGTPVAAALEAQPVSDVTPATTYTVVRGDSLWSIASKTHLSKSDLAAANNLKSTSVLRVGQKLIIPSKPGEAAATAPGPAAVSAEKPATTGETIKHTVKPGETLGAIARRYGVRQGDIAVANNITDPRRIQPGQELVIPAKSSGGAKGTPAKASAGAGEAPSMDTGAKVAPGGDQDLDAGLKTPSDTDVPAIKVGDATPPKGP
jgi:LysM repeat protein